MERTLDGLTETQPDQRPDESAPVAVASPRRMAAFLAVGAVVVVLDQLSKWWLRAAVPLGGSSPIIPGWVHLSHVLNRGAAWSMLDGQRFFLIGITLFVIFVLSRIAREVTARSAVATVGLGLILGGAVGNLIDRVVFGSVTDFIDLDTPWVWLQTFPVFNIADSALTVGVILLLLDFLFGGKPAPPAPVE